MEKVTGIGGAFFRAKDPKMLAQWYEDHLGIDQLPEEYGILGWRPKGGATVFMPFDSSMKDFKNITNQDFMFNFRVANMDAMVKQLRNAGIEVNVGEKPEPNGRFALLADPEGNVIELWEPAGVEKDVEEK
ncbi:VOC family protein [Maritalea porphyrae]|uniref:VOC family protein n=1 Tax=Maritalea porphyrae TaxID=880732 RepID=UPI0022AF4185|nr:VOC family protein [Maritalea porphyrae]MCZ4272626.1 VOC family protein [Maritalea porphyrae]